jgi:hypothetical protein
VKNKIGMSLLAASILINVGCSSTNSAGKKEIREDVQIAMEQTGYRCEKTISVGSNIKKKRCSTKKMRDAQREAAVNSIERGQGGHATAGGDL